MESAATRSLLASSVDAAAARSNMVKQTAVTMKAEAMDTRAANHTTAFRYTFRRFLKKYLHSDAEFYLLPRNDDVCDTSSCSALITNSAQSTPFHHVYQVSQSDILRL